MKIEFGFQANCSELVTHLGITERSEVLKALETIARITGWTWGAQREIEGVIIRIPMERMNEVLVTTEEEIGVVPNSILSIWNDKLDERTKQKIIKFSKRFLLQLVLYKNTDDSIVISTEPEYELRFYCCGYSGDCQKKGLTMALFQHHEAHKMPAFHAIRKEFDLGYETHGGGSTDSYMEWMAYHFVDKERTKEAVRATPRIEWLAESIIADYEEYPPLDRSKGLTEEEIMKIKEEVYEEYPSLDESKGFTEEKSKIKTSNDSG
ncbi:MAG: hypothetical protein FJZ89_06300 [Chloroflexi bacterium]|nr:hypothetical protein [Chloroflexota bacterium]